MFNSLKEKHPLLSRLSAWILLPLLAICLAMYLWLSSDLPTANSVVEVTGKHGTAVISRNEWGVPTISAKQDLSAFFALGLAHAQDRLWQMDYQRRLGKGRLAEILGVSALSSDKLMRTLDLKTAAESALNGLSDKTRSILKAYVDGVNQGISALKVMPIEFYYYDIDIEPWSESDSLLLIKLMAMNLGANYQDELSNSILVKHLGRVKAHELLGINIAPAHDVPATSAQEFAALSEFYQNIERQYHATWEGVGSNAWVVSGRHTQSSLPMLSGDPHLRLQLPTTFYLAKLQGELLDVTGATIPGVPAVIFGHNRHIAWSGVNLAADVQDIYLERQHQVNENLFEYNGAWVKANIKVEKIVVAQQFPAFLRAPYQPLEWQVRSTSNGPLLSDVFGSDRHFSLKWSVLDPVDTSLQSFLEVNYARDQQTFSLALEQHHAPALAFVYGDVADNIGLFTAGKIPIRHDANGQLPVPGWTAQYQWQGYVPFEEMPQQMNPESGIIVTANNQMHGPSYPHIISNNWQPDFRAQRIADLLLQHIQEKNKLSLGDMAAIQSDVYAIHAEKVVAFLLQSVAKTSAQDELVSVLEDWNMEMSARSAGAVIFRAWSRHFNSRVIGDELKVQFSYPNRMSILDGLSASYQAEFIAAVINGEHRAWCDDVTTEAIESCEKMAQLSLIDAKDELELMLGGNPESWQWQDMHKVTLPHSTFSQHPFLAKFFNQEHATQGGLYTVNVAGGSYSKDEGYIKHMGATYRQLIDLGALSDTQFILDTGQSGHLFSPHYTDMVERFERGEYVSIDQSELGQTQDAGEK
ncbi:penicillin acylase family protein [Pseudoalteromonas luteoviolacea]|uniref:penicillin acylase family protein n=1 Tax=Pseudoalteromonas luteoviolacea TaxID=43657 RepID=UPI001B384866|nr:penicillin acylase family protein [Pseudoalteromonas luteoviolacea]MBQ4835993.1 penicillin acylase family protein [Pseudoalteromonas luteoviolacea]